MLFAPRNPKAQPGALLAPGVLPQISGFGFQALCDLDAMPLKRFNDFACACQIAPDHGAAAIDRPTRAIEPDHIDVGRALGFAFFEDFLALIDHRVERAFDDFLVTDFALRQV